MQLCWIKTRFTSPIFRNDCLILSTSSCVLHMYVPDQQWAAHRRCVKVTWPHYKYRRNNHISADTNYCWVKTQSVRIWRLGDNPDTSYHWRLGKSHIYVKTQHLFYIPKIPRNDAAVIKTFQHLCNHLNGRCRCGSFSLWHCASHVSCFGYFSFIDHTPTQTPPPYLNLTLHLFPVTGNPLEHFLTKS